jgi:hypothetical protein
MIGCSQTRKLIDESDNIELFSFEASRHIAACPHCRDFAEERTRLRHLLSSSARVAAPANFDSLLSVRLAGVRSRNPVAKGLALLTALSGPVGLLRFGAATAAVAIGVFVASYSGLLSTPPQTDDKNSVASVDTQQPSAPVAQEITLQPPTIDHQADQRQFITTSDASRRARRQVRRPVVIEPELATAGGQTVILRGDNFEREVPMPTVSVGAQPLMFVGTGRNSSGGMRASF